MIEPNQEYKPRRVDMIDITCPMGKESKTGRCLVPLSIKPHLRGAVPFWDTAPALTPSSICLYSDCTDCPVYQIARAQTLANQAREVLANAERRLTA
ncbi:TPA: hypothetical protein HA371_07015 [Candidatus Woesearchaeota archaeon]|nr:hypothetical protein [Candidatus Woesearchaeota archaeon]